MKPCPFCSLNEKTIIFENALLFVIRDAYPVTPGHLLIIPKRHVPSFFNLTQDEKDAILDTIDRMKTLLDERHAPEGYNIGVNVGEAAGQTVDHVHIHLIPRYASDMEDPRGGVRGVIPSKQKYGDDL